MSIHVLSLAVKRTRSTRGARLVLIALSNNANDEGFSWPTNRSLRSWTGLSERGVQMALARLSASGEIALVDHGGGSRRGATWRVVVGVEGASDTLDNLRAAAATPPQKLRGSTPAETAPLPRRNCGGLPPQKLRGTPAETAGDPRSLRQRIIADPFIPVAVAGERDACASSATEPAPIQAEEVERPRSHALDKPALALADDVIAILGVDPNARGMSAWWTSGVELARWLGEGVEPELVRAAARRVAAQRRGRPPGAVAYLRPVIDELRRAAEPRFERMEASDGSGFDGAAVAERPQRGRRSGIDLACDRLLASVRSGKGFGGGA